LLFIVVVVQGESLGTRPLYQVENCLFRWSAGVLLHGM